MKFASIRIADVVAHFRFNRSRIRLRIRILLYGEMHSRAIAFTGSENKIGQAFYNKQGYKATTEIMFRKRPQNGG